MGLAQFPPLAALRVLLLVVWFMITCLVGLIMCIFRWRDPNVPSLLTNYVYAPLSLLICGIRVHHRDYDKNAPRRSAIFLANHQSVLDLAILGSATPPRTVCVAKSELKWIPLFGLFWYASGNVFIERKKLTAAKASLDTATRRLRDNECSVWLFVEGTRNYRQPTVPLPFKKGPFHMAVAAGVPIATIVCSNQTRCFDPLRGRWPGGDVILRALPPIPTTGKTTADVDALVEETRARMARAMKELDAELDIVAERGGRVGDAISKSGADTLAACERVAAAIRGSGDARYAPFAEVPQQLDSNDSSSNSNNSAASAASASASPAGGVRKRRGGASGKSSS